MAKKYIIWIVIIIALIAAGYFYLQSKKPKTTYTTFNVERGNLAQTVSVTGKANPENQYDLAFKISGRLEMLAVDIGDTVSAKQKLATIDKGSLLSQLKQAQAGITVQKRTLADMKRRKSVYKKSQVDIQRANIKTATEAANVFVDQLRELSIYSPIDGKVIHKSIEQGENVIANNSILTIAKDGDLIIEANIPESDIVKVKIGQKANVTFDALTADDVYEAEVMEIDPASTLIQDVVYYRTKLKFSNSDQRIMPGMSANIDIKTEEKNDILMIPLRAIITEGNQKFVNILKDPVKNLTEKIKVTTGLVGDEGMVEIKSGLKAGDSVVTFTKSGA